VRALFVQNKVRFARAEQLCAPCMMHQRFALGVVPWGTAGIGGDLKQCCQTVSLSWLSWPMITSDSMSSCSSSYLPLTVGDSHDGERRQQLTDTFLLLERAYSLNLSRRVLLSGPTLTHSITASTTRLWSCIN